MMRMMANAPALTTATACSSAVTGVGATDTVGSHACTGKSAAFTPKPTNDIRNTASSRSFLSATRAISSMPP